MCPLDDGKLRPLKRDQMKFDLLDIYAKYALERKDSDFLDSEVVEAFLDRASHILSESLRQDQRNSQNLLRGYRTENMFEAVLASIGKIGFIQQLDIGSAWFREDLQVPDFMAELVDGRIVLIEVKNCHQNPSNPTKPFKLGQKSFNKLEGYALLTGTPLYFAIYFDLWCQWCLIPSSVFEKQGGTMVVSFTRAMMQNEMVRTGDILIATVPPLSLTFQLEQFSPPIGNEGGHVELRITDAHIEAGGIPVDEKVEQDIAFRLAMYGIWAEEERVLMDQGRVTEIRYRYSPREPGTQSFSMIGSLSQMASKWFLSNTSSEGNHLTQITSKISPETLGTMIPDDYESSVLKLWRFHLRPSRTIQPRNGMT